MTDHDTTIREAREWAQAITNPGLSQQGGLPHVIALLAVIEQQQATIDRQAETLQQALGRILDRGPR